MNRLFIFPPLKIEKSLLLCEYTVVQLKYDMGRGEFKMGVMMRAQVVLRYTVIFLLFYTNSFPSSKSENP